MILIPYICIAILAANCLLGLAAAFLMLFGKDY